MEYLIIRKKNEQINIISSLRSNIEAGEKTGLIPVIVAFFVLTVIFNPRCISSLEVSYLYPLIKAGIFITQDKRSHLEKRVKRFNIKKLGLKSPE